MRTKIRRPKSDRQKENAKLTALWSEYIRKRAMYLNNGCQRCKAWKKSWKELQAHHCFTSRNLTTRWDDRNGAGLCGGCHTYVQQHDDANMELFRELIGSYQLQLLYITTNLTIKQAPIDRKAIEIYLKTKIKELDCCCTTTV